jgi:hypothetical protein
MKFFAFLGALALSVLAFELLTVFQNAFSTFGGNRLNHFTSQPQTKRRSAWEALLIAILPGRFNPDSAKNMGDVISLLRRAGYPYDTPGEFYAAAIRDFSTFLLVGGLLAGALAAMDVVLAAPVIAMIFILLGLRRP